MNCIVAKTKIFLDTNIFVYTLDGHDSEKQATARAIVRDVVESQLPVISTQVLQEFYSASTTKLKIDAMTAKNIVHNLGNMEVVHVDLPREGSARPGFEGARGLEAQQEVGGPQQGIGAVWKRIPADLHGRTGFAGG